MPQPLYFSEFEQPAPAKISKPSDQTWFNRYGGYIVETRWNSQKKQYESIYHQYDYPDTSLMPSQ